MEENRTPEEMADEIWSDLLDRCVDLEINCGGESDLFGHPYVMVTIGLGRENPVLEYGQPFNSVMVDATPECRAMAFASSFERWLDGRSILIWRTTPQAVALTDKSSYSGNLPALLEMGRCSQMVAFLTAYSAEEFAERLKEKREERLKAIPTPTRPILADNERSEKR